MSWESTNTDVVLYGSAVLPLPHDLDGLKGGTNWATTTRLLLHFSAKPRGFSVWIDYTYCTRVQSPMTKLTAKILVNKQYMTHGCSLAGAEVFIVCLSEALCSLPPFYLPFTLAVSAVY